MRLGAFHVWIKNVDETALQEYPSKEAPIQGNSASAYIASQPGLQFSIWVRNECGHDASVVFYVDGQMASVLLCYGRPQQNLIVCRGIQPEAGLLRRFVFQKANLTGSHSPFT
jgi:hypothetical protein